MKKFIVSFMELSSYEVIVNAESEEAAIEIAKNLPAQMRLTQVAYDYFEAETVPPD